MYGSGMEYLMDITAFHNKTEMFGIIQNKTIGMTHSMHLQYKKNSQTNTEVMYFRPITFSQCTSTLP